MIDTPAENRAVEQLSIDVDQNIKVLYGTIEALQDRRKRGTEDQLVQNTPR